MLSRRKFIKKTAALGSFSFLGTFAPSEQLKPSGPIAIATWGNNTKATEQAYKILKSGGYALDAVEQGIHIPEADPNDTSVGYGGNPDRDGFVTLDACVMNEKGNAGSVTFLQHIMHPVSVARQVMEKTPHVLLSGDGALQFALQNGFKKENLLTDSARERWLEWIDKNKYTPIISRNNHDTIGLLAIDSKNTLCGGCSTSGAAYKLHGRVGDSPIIGAGLFVDNETGGATGTGLGELMLKNLSSFLIVEYMRQGIHPQKACEMTVKRMVKKYGADHQAAFVALDKKGNYGAFSIQPNFDYALSYQDKTIRKASDSYQH